MYIRNRLNSLDETVEEPKDYVIEQRDTVDEVLTMIYVRDCERQKAG